MKRRKFLGALGVGAAGVSLALRLPLKEEPVVERVKEPVKKWNKSPMDSLSEVKLMSTPEEMDGGLSVLVDTKLRMYDTLIFPSKATPTGIMEIFVVTSVMGVIMPEPSSGKYIVLLHPLMPGALYIKDSLKKGDTVVMAGSMYAYNSSEVEPETRLW